MSVALNPTISTAAVVGLFIAFTIKHLIADYLLQTAGMVHGKEARHGWLLPLSLHAGIHAVCTLLVVLAVDAAFWWLGAADFLVHGTVDRLKSVASAYGGWRPEEYRFWWLHGADQAAHHLTHFAFVLLLTAGFVID